MNFRELLSAALDDPEQWDSTYAGEALRHKPSGTTWNVSGGWRKFDLYEAPGVLKTWEKALLWSKVKGLRRARIAQGFTPNYVPDPRSSLVQAAAPNIAAGMAVQGSSLHINSNTFTTTANSIAEYEQQKRRMEMAQRMYGIRPSGEL